jgi:16S rRNA U516 pseudouridylate synthase RsuA-like enzyme
VIKTVAQRKGRSEAENTLVARTRPCGVTRTGSDACRMTLVEGRNRQIRKMMEALGFEVTRLHRIEFMGIRLASSSGAGGGGGSSLERPGDWAYLDDGEMRLVEDALWSASEEM